MLLGIKKTCCWARSAVSAGQERALNVIDDGMGTCHRGDPEASRKVAALCPLSTWCSAASPGAS